MPHGYILILKYRSIPQNQSEETYQTCLPYDQHENPNPTDSKFSIDFVHRFVIWVIGVGQETAFTENALPTVPCFSASDGKGEQNERNAFHDEEMSVYLETGYIIEH